MEVATTVGPGNAGAHSDKINDAKELMQNGHYARAERILRPILTELEGAMQGKEHDESKYSEVLTIAWNLGCCLYKQDKRGEIDELVGKHPALMIKLT